VRIRRTLLLVYRDTATADERARLLRGLAFLGLECPTVAAGDYGDDILGGSTRLVEIPPWERTPRFHARAEGPPSNYDVALHLDFDDEAALAAYEGHPAQAEMLAFAGSVTVPDLAARLDWRYDGESLNRRGGYRHCGLHVWRDDADEGARLQALDAVRSLAGAAGVEAVTVGESDTGRPADFDWILDVRFADEQAARSFLTGEPYTAAVEAVARATKHEWTARVTHLIRGV
jgi:hypothetical protein